MNTSPAPRRRWWIVLGCAGLLLLGAGVAAWMMFGKSELPKPGERAYDECVEAFESGTAAMDAGLYDVAEKELSRGIKLAPGEPALWANRALGHVRLLNKKAAKADLAKAAQLAPGNPDVEEMLSVLAQADGKLDAAIQHVKNALAVTPEDDRRLFRLSQLLEQNSAPDADAERLKIFDALLKRRPTSLPVLAERAALAVRAPDRKALDDTLARMERLSPNWGAQTRALFAKVKEISKGNFDPSDFSLEVAQLGNLLKAEAGFARSGRELEPNPESVGAPIRNFLRLAAIRSAPDEPDAALSFAPRQPDALTVGLAAPDVIVPWWPKAKADVGVLAAGAKGVTASADLKLPAFPSGGKGVKPSPHGILPVDLNNDGRTDLVFAGASGLVILRQTPDGTMKDVTTDAKLPDEIRKGDYFGAWAADVDMDGDLDVILARRDGELTLLVNNANGTFTPRPIFASVKAARAFVWADLDNDGAPDAALLDAAGKLHAFMNERSGQFTKIAAPDVPFAAIAAADLNDDGTFDLGAMAQDGQLMRLSLAIGEGVTWDAKPLAKLGDKLPLTVGETLLQAIDLDSNGAIDLVLRTPAGGVAWLADGKGEWVKLEATLPPGLAEIFPERSTSLLVVGVEKGTPTCAVVKGTKGYNSDVYRLNADPLGVGDQRLNAFGIGSELETRSRSLITKQVIDRPAVHVGCGRRSKVIVARITWTNGSTQYEFDKAPGEEIVVDQRLKGSCPFLFTWDGTKMAFVTDFCWSTPLGLYINNVKRGGGFAQTTEWLKVRGDQLKPRDGLYDVRISATLWETHYLDLLSLTVVDHPPDTELHLDERFFLTPTPPRLYLTTPSRPVLKATDHNGKDVTDVVRDNDGTYLANAGLGRYQGLTRDHWVTIDVGDVSGDGPLYLLAHGWLQPTDSSLNVAIEQRGDRPMPLTLEVPDGDGWKPHGAPLGFPAGKHKTCVIRLDENMRKVRLRTNMEIYWDSLRVARGLDEKQCRTHALTATTAELRYRGVLRMTRESRTSPEIPQYDQIIGGQPWRDLIGYHTRFGDVRELVAKVDDRYVILNAGDELRMTFAAPEASASGWKRDYVWVSDGWTKDGDLNTRWGKTVLPLPWHGMKDYDTPPGRLEDDPVYKRHAADWKTYHTRYVTPERFRQGLRAVSEGASSRRRRSHLGLDRFSPRGKIHPSRRQEAEPMESPFPGMDPYLEHPGYWRDFHQRFITYWSDWLADNLPDHYDVSIDERLGVVAGDGEGKVMLPDVAISQNYPLPEEAQADVAIATLDREPVERSIKYVDEETESYLRITHRPSASLIAVLELLSPTNKDGKGGRQSYLKKRNEFLYDTVHLVELDLLLGGMRVPIEGKLPAGDYFAYVARGDQRPICEVYSWKLPERLSRIRLPLKPPDPDVVFDLPALVALAYQRGRYARRLPYASPPPVALPGPYAAWAAERLKQWQTPAGG